MRNIRIMLAVSLLALAMTGCRAFVDFAVGEPVSQPPQQAQSATVVAAVNANVRAGDSTAYAITGGLNAGQTAPVLGISSTGSGWYYIQTPDGALGFISPDVVTVQGNLSGLTAVVPPNAPVVTSVPATQPPTQTMANLTVSNLALAGGAVNCSDRTSIVFTITNTGTATAPESVMKLAMLTMPQMSIVVEVTGTVPPIAPGASVQTGADLFLNASPNGSYTLRGIADIDARVPESNENDNFADLGIAINCGGNSGGANLRVTALGLSNGAVNCSDRTSIFFAVTNDGPSAVGESFAVLEVIAPSPVTVSMTVPPLQAGETFNSGADLFLNTLLAGTYQMRVTADSGSAISESNEGDNVSESAFSVACG
jgi:subtilase family serine protease